MAKHRLFVDGAADLGRAGRVWVTGPQRGVPRRRRSKIRRALAGPVVVLGLVLSLTFGDYV